mmetsp:Transcript_26943/g.49001  ORF Transcript_26943/g.49001 Transcript_26943/m.49001 type:complete len:92 (+) Transcript_26943:138-413(+)
MKTSDWYRSSLGKNWDTSLQFSLKMQEGAVMLLYHVHRNDKGLSGLDLQLVHPSFGRGPGITVHLIRSPYWSDTKDQCHFLLAAQKMAVSS